MEIRARTGSAKPQTGIDNPIQYLNDKPMHVDTEVWPAGAPEIGQKAEMTRQVTAQDIERFTAISGDRNPLHYDEAVARATKFGGIVVQGGVTSAILNAVVAKKLPGPRTVFLRVEWNFKTPVRPGNKITGSVEVTNVRIDKPITELLTAVKRDDGTIVIEGKALCYTFPVRAEQINP